jgi:hypothetical protein
MYVSVFQTDHRRADEIGGDGLEAAKGSVPFAYPLFDAFLLLYRSFRKLIIPLSFINLIYKKPAYAG